MTWTIEKIFIDKEEYQSRFEFAPSMSLGDDYTDIQTMKALILAGGFAKRLWPLTLDKAKPLLPIAGRPVISHIVDKIPASIPIVVSTNEAFSKDFLQWKQTHPDHDISLFFEPATNEQTKKGALAAVGLALRAHGMNEDWIVLGGDNFFTFSIEEFLDHACGKPMLAVHDIHDLELAKKFGVVVMDENRATRFVEKPVDPPSTQVATGCFYFPAHTLPLVLEAAELMPDKLGGVFEYFLQKEMEVHAHTLPGYWNDIGSFDAYLDAHQNAGVDLEIPAHFLAAECANSFEGVNHLSPDCQIRNSHIINSIILSGCVVQDASIDSCILDHRSQVLGERRAHEIIRPS